MSPPMPFDLRDRTIVVTGGGGHLGSAMALGLAYLGATVVICGRRAEPLERVAKAAAGCAGRVLPCPADVSRDGDLDRVVAQAEDAGTLTGWINNAYAGAPGRLIDASRTEVSQAVERGLVDVIMATQAVARSMMRSGGGSIVNVASMYGVVAPQPRLYANHERFHNPPAYGAAKAGVIAFTRYAACELAAHGIRVNCVSPGPFPSEAVQASAPGFVAALEERVPLGRIGAPGELVGAVAYLVSEASSYVTGHNLVVDGGWTAW